MNNIIELYEGFKELLLAGALGASAFASNKADVPKEKPAITRDINSMTINLDKIWELESTRGKNPNMKTPGVLTLKTNISDFTSATSLAQKKKGYVVKNRKGTYDVKKVGALGHFQFLKDTWDSMVDKMDKDWDWKTGAVDYTKSKQVADYYLNTEIPRLLKYYKLPDTVDLRLGAYNWGIGFVKKAYESSKENWIEKAPEETKNYIKKYKSI